MTRHLACAEGELKPGTSMVVDGAIPIAVFRTESGAYRATADTCTHEKWSLGEEGDIEGEEVVCPLHMARFDLETGAALCFPATVGLRVFPVEIEDGKVYVVED